MSFEKAYLLIPLIIILALYIFMSIKRDSLLTRIVTENWLIKTNKVFWLRRCMFYLGVIILTLSLLDPRGEVIKVEGSIPDQKTVMLIDTSSSMFVEDVRPNRYKRAIFLARHFVKKAVGHKVSIVLFSDIQKRIVPFTDDLDLLDARLSALDNTIGAGGGSNLSQAIEESLQYFKTTDEEDGIRGGNLLILTDSEGHDGALNNNVSEKINVAMVGVGTARGGKVPIRDSRGVFRGYKKHNDIEVESKLNEKWMKSLGGKIKSYKYWIANSYSMPTTEVIDFFRSTFTKSLSKGNVNIRPVLFHKSAIVGILLIMFSYLLYPFKNFSTVIIVCFFLSGFDVHANPEKKETKSYELEAKHREGEINEAELIYFIEELLKDKDYDRAALLYEERLESLDPLSHNNYGLALVGLKKKGEALDAFRRAETDLISKKGNPELLKIVRKNILLLIKKEKDEKKKGKDKKEDMEKDKGEDKKKNQEKKKDKKNKKEDKQSKDQKQKKDSEKKQNQDKSEEEKSKDKKEGKGKSEEDQKEKKKKEKQKSEEERKNEEKESGKDEKNREKKKKKEKSLKQKVKEKEKENSLKRKMKKIPGVIKQIMSDDRELQRKHIDTSTKERSNYKKRDW